MPLWTGKQLITLILPEIDMTGFHSTHPDDEETPMSPGDTRVIFKAGVHLAGIISKRTIGASSGGLIHVIFNDHGPSAGRDFLDNVALIINQWLIYQGFSVGIGDALISEQTYSEVVNIVDEQYAKANELLTSFQNGTFEAQGNLSVDETKEQQLQQILAKARDASGKLISACVGQQIVEGKRIARTFGDRTLPHFTKHEDTPESRGFVRNSFIRGLTPQEVWFHAMGGREGLIDTAVKSVTWDTTIVVIERGIPLYIRIGEWIDGIIANSPASQIEHQELMNMELVKIPERAVFIATMDNAGAYLEVMFRETRTPEIKVGDHLPVTTLLRKPPVMFSAVQMDDGSNFRLTRANGTNVGFYLAGGDGSGLPVVFSPDKNDARCIPDALFCAPDSFVVGFLHGYFARNGTTSDTETSNIRVVASTSSSRFAEALAMLCSRIAVFASISSDHTVSISGPDAVSFLEKTYLCGGNKLTALEGIRKQKDVALDRIIRTSPIGLQSHPKMYDLTVPGTLNFSLANGLQVRDTAETGYIQRRLYGEDGFDGIAIENQTFEIMLSSDDIFRDRYYSEAVPDEFDELTEARAFLRKQLRQPEDRWPMPLKLKRIILAAQRKCGDPPVPIDERFIYEQVTGLRRKLRPATLKVVDTDGSQSNPTRLFNILLLSSFSSKQFNRGLVAAAESVGVVTAQSIGEPATQMTLNSVEYQTELLLDVDGHLVRTSIGDFVEQTFRDAPADTIETHPMDTFLAWIKGKRLNIVSCDEDGKVTWRAVEAVAQHPVVNEHSTQVTTQSGRFVVATKAISFVNRVNNKIVPVDGVDLKVGDYLPISKILPTDFTTVECLDVCHYLPATLSGLPEQINLDRDFGWMCGADLANGSCADRHVESTTIRPHSTALSRLFTAVFENGSLGKRIPAELLGGPLDFLKGLIAGYIDGDACVTPQHDVQSPVRKTRTPRFIFYATGDCNCMLDFQGHARRHPASSPAVEPTLFYQRTINK
ncbi:DNA-directed RNA polymerase [Powellomyces hirtus]|uniref:DNA-directed RNA polymerase n=1 Tax=Powellomyces hirtus TaxID=109895 RepID=A0A507E602_9FUNG|nr:DNA-directed RNA polymerase [Powellomyces hirtus]